MKDYMKTFGGMFTIFIIIIMLIALIDAIIFRYDMNYFCLEDGYDRYIKENNEYYCVSYEIVEKPYKGEVKEKSKPLSGKEFTLFFDFLFE